MTLKGWMGPVEKTQSSSSLLARRLIPRAKTQTRKIYLGVWLKMQMSLMTESSQKPPNEPLSFARHQNMLNLFAPGEILMTVR